MIDTNDNAPDFGLDAFEYTLSEGFTSGTPLSPLLTAEDPDEGTNAIVRYSLSGTNDFEINPDTGVISVATGVVLDRETTPVYSFQVEAENSEASTAQFGSIDVTVVLEDINDNDPEFDEPGGFTEDIREVRSCTYDDV